MKTERNGLAAMLLLMAALIAADQPPAQSLPAVHVSGAGIATPADWSAARIKSDMADQIKTIEYSSHGQTHHSTCVPVLEILQASGLGTELKHDPTADPRTKHIPLRLAVTVLGKDGYAATFSLAELLPSVGKAQAWLALDEDGSDLPPEQAPMKLIVPTDGDAGRWVHAVAEIKITDPTAASTQPASK
jgi:hypothetical protein